MLTSWTVERIIKDMADKPLFTLGEILTKHVDIAKDDVFDTVIGWLKQMNQYDSAKLIESERQRLKDEGLF